MLADFGVRLAFGLLIALLLTPWRSVPPRFFRIQHQIILGILALTAMAEAQSAGPSPRFWLVVAAAGSSYLASVAWGLGLPPAATGLGLIGSSLSAAWIVAASWTPGSGTWLLMGLTRATSGILLGATLSSMLLGHYYLIAPAMTIEPLKRSLGLIAAGLAARLLLAVVGTWTTSSTSAPAFSGGLSSDLALLAMRWGLGFAGAGVSVYLAWRTAAIRSTQSATGILYITTIFVLFGELAAILIISRGVIC